MDVSIIIPTHNEGDWLRRTVESVVGSKTELQYEILILDDGCSDGSVEAISAVDKVRIISTGGKRLGLIAGKNLGAEASQGSYLCFLDSHVLVHDNWLDFLRETCDNFQCKGLVSGNLPDVNQFVLPGTRPRQQFGYTITNRILDAGWYFHNRDYTHQPYLQPLTPGGLMFTSKSYFTSLGGFSRAIRKWGAEDIEISLRNYFMGGENIVDPRVIVKHYYKQPGNIRWATREQLTFNCLYTASLYFPYEYYLAVQQSLIRTRWLAPSFLSELNSDKHRQLINRSQSHFVRTFEHWIAAFPNELRNFLNDVESKISKGYFDFASVKHEHELPAILKRYLSILGIRTD